ncbi:MAG: hypothetical protein ISS36_02200 [Candidatus Aenigmarchaeota archaeon]|nr:hypothetical protein [Candidatus Aenigmarchaeota archaeon]
MPTYLSENTRLKITESGGIVTSDPRGETWAALSSSYRTFVRGEDSDVLEHVDVMIEKFPKKGDPEREGARFDGSTWERLVFEDGSWSTDGQLTPDAIRRYQREAERYSGA